MAKLKSKKQKKSSFYEENSLVGLTPGINFTNILFVAFSYESFSRSFFVLTFYVCTFSGTKAYLKMLVKLTHDTTKFSGPQKKFGTKEHDLL